MLILRKSSLKVAIPVCFLGISLKSSYVNILHIFLGCIGIQVIWYQNKERMFKIQFNVMVFRYSFVINLQIYETNQIY